MIILEKDNYISSLALVKFLLVTWLAMDQGTPMFIPSIKLVLGPS